MRLNSYIITITCLFAFASCRSVRKVTSTDKSGSTKVTKKYGKEKREFINGIEVILGTTTTTKHKTTSVASNSNKKSSNYNKAEAEKASYLQIKYAPIIEVPTKRLDNIPLLELMDKWWGTKYCIGGNSEKCIDCSGFSILVMNSIYNVKLPRTAQDQYNFCRRVELEDLQEGDLVFFGLGKKSISHVGIYLQNNKFFHASTSVGVTITSMNDAYWKPKFRGGGRY